MTTTDPALAFAPLVHLHQDERAMPMAASTFIDYSTLSWANDPCLLGATLAIGEPRSRLKRDESEPLLDPRRLGGSGGAAPYSTRPLRPSCSGHDRRRYMTSQRTTPWGSGPRPPGLRAGEGFFLDLLTARLGGATDDSRDGPQAVIGGVPVYYDTRRHRLADGGPGLRIDYWVLYGYESPRPKSAGDHLAHEGDWERMSVLLRQVAPRRYAPLVVRYHRDGAVRDVPWRATEVAAGAGASVPSHPVAYAALGSHALYPSPGVRERQVRAGTRTVRVRDLAARCDGCPQWRTWSRLRALRDEPWNGYGGGWGVVTLDAATSGREGPLVAVGRDR